MHASRSWAIAIVAVTVAGATGVGAAAKRYPDRPFDHQRHESVSCRACHGTGEQHRAIFIRGALDCAACHHVAARNKRCRDCHSADQLASVTSATTRVSLSVWDSTASRSLPFKHTNHQRVECRQCHAAEITLARIRECGSCHEQHHRPEADCSSCHERPRTSAHPVETHLSCAASQCHSAKVAPEPSSSRNLCLVCHREQALHEPKKDCATCHRIPDAETAAALKEARQ